MTMLIRVKAMLKKAKNCCWDGGVNERTQRELAYYRRIEHLDQTTYVPKEYYR